MGLENAILVNAKLVTFAKMDKQDAHSASISVPNAVPMTSEYASNVVGLALKILQGSV
jgi:hypothetical protein